MVKNAWTLSFAISDQKYVLADVDRQYVYWTLMNIFIFLVFSEALLIEQAIYMHNVNVLLMILLLKCSVNNFTLKYILPLIL